MTLMARPSVYERCRTAPIVPERGYAGTGYRTVGDAWLATAAAAPARERRRIAREELTSTTAAALSLTA
jgi:hypothetical protein